MKSRTSRRSSSGRFDTILLALLTVVVSWSAGAAVEGDRSNFDALQASPGMSRSAVASSPSTTSVKGRRAHIDNRLGVPSFIWLDGSKTGSKSGGLSLQGAGSAREVLTELAPIYGLSRADVDAAPSREWLNRNGSRIVTFTNEIGGIEVWRDEMSILFDPAGRAVAVSGSLASSALGKNGDAKFKLSPGAAAAIAATDAAGVKLPESAFQNSGRRHANYGFLKVAPGLPIDKEVRIKQVYYRMPDRLIPAYYLELWVFEEEVTTHLWGYVVSAEDGTLLNRTSLTASESFSYRVWADTTAPNTPFAGPMADFMPHPTGTNDGSFPPYVAPNLITLQNVPFSQNDPWLGMGAVETDGNNVDAYADISGSDGFDASDLRASVTAPGEFDRVYDTGAEPGVDADQRMASITQLFYSINFLHDWFYDAGFDEAAGNAQADNYGRGGIDGDPIRGEGQDTDGANLNNANMSTPADGAQPRMQMYLWNPKVEVSLVTTATGGSSLEVGYAYFGPVDFNVTADVVLAVDVTAPTSDACEPLMNDLTGKIALVDRGLCTFTTKVAYAQAAGAVGVLVANYQTGVFNMTGLNPSITIPSLMITLADGNTIKAALGSPVNATMNRVTGPLIDGTIDNGIVAHEWAHYLSNRLINLGSKQSVSMGEGWSDFVALLMLVREGDDPDGVYGMAQYATQGVSADAGYFGIRRYPYSTDMAVNPLTFEHIEDGVALPVGPPVSPAGPNSEVHNSGEVWAQMLWEGYAALLKDTPRLTFADAQQRMKEYLVASMKITPSNPTFVEARDALLAVVWAADVEDFQLFCAAFAKRGIGTGAVAPDRFSTTHSGVVESFVCGGDLIHVDSTLDDSVASCDGDGILDAGETGLLTLTFENIGGTTLTSSTVTLSTTNPNVMFVDDPIEAIPVSDPFGTVSVTARVSIADGTTGLQSADFELAFTDPGFATPGVRISNAEFLTNIDETLNASAVDDVEAVTVSWTQGGTPVLGGYWERRTESLTSHYWHADDPEPTSDSSLISPPLQVLGSGDLVISFDHRHQFESDITADWDGGVIEISTDGGGTWTDVGASASPGYGGTITDLGTNPLALRQAFVGTSAGYPAWVPTTVNLGTTYAGQTVLFRFRLGADELVGAPGWDVDNIAVAGISNTPFAVRYADPGCGQLSISDLIVIEGDSGSTNADLTLTRGGSTGGTSTVDWQTAPSGTASAGSDFVVASGTTTFLPSETVKTITVQILGDAVVEADETFSVLLANPSDAFIADGQAIVTIQNDDTAGVTVTPVSGVTTTEAGGSGGFSIVLTSQPVADVTINLSSSDLAEGMVSPSSVTFTALTWNVAQPVAVTGVDDAIADGDQAYTIVTSDAISTDGDYGGMVVADVSVTNVDDDVAGIAVTPVSGVMTTEAGGSGGFSIVLTSQPVADVTIGLSSSDLAEGTVSPSSVTFTALTWNVAQPVAVTGVDDALVDGDQVYTIVTSDAVSTDVAYGGMVVADVTVTNVDDDSPGVMVTPVSGLTTTEVGGSANFSIVLSSEPVADVTIALSTSDGAEGAVSPSSVTFTALTWNVTQMVTVTGVDDAIADGDQVYTIVTSDAISTDVAYGGMVVADVTVTNVDDDSPGVTVTPVSGLTTTEVGGSANFSIVLSSEPVADVTITLSSSDGAEGAVSPASITFTVSTWNVAQMVTVTGVDDALADGDQPYTVFTGDAISADPAYDGMVVEDVDVTNEDDETSVDDSDGDGVNDSVEDLGPNGGDANGDGQADSTQSTVTTLPAANGNGYLTVISTCELRSVRAVLPSEVGPAPLTLPYALVEFRMPCASASMTVLYHAGTAWNAEVGYWKYGPETPGQALTTKWYELPGVTFDTTAVAGSTVARARFTLEDGQLGDDTGVDGVIVDQGGPGTPAPVDSIPTASELMLLTMMLLLGAVGFLKLR